MKKIIMLLICLFIIMIFCFNFLTKETESDFTNKTPEEYGIVLEE